MNCEGKNFLGKSLSLDATASGEVDFAIKQAGPEAILTELSSPGIQVSVEALAGRDEFTLTAPEANPVKVIFDRTGRIRDIKNAQALEEQNIMNFSVVEVLRSYLPAFPDSPVSIGDSWKDHRRILIPFQEMNLAVELDILFRLDDVLPSPEGKAAMISADYTVALSGSKDLGEVMGLFEGKGSGSGNLNALISQGYFTEYRLNYAIDGAMVLRKYEKTLVEWPFHLYANADLMLLEKRESPF
jgi:hypothetical protein